MDAHQAEIELEQNYFDRAADERERRRAVLSEGHKAGAGPNSGIWALKKALELERDKLGDRDDPVAFGRVILHDGSPLYIGHHAISDNDQNLLVIGWEAPAANCFYEATYDDDHGVAVKRQYATSNNRVNDFDDVVFRLLAQSVGDLMGTPVIYTAQGDLTAPEQWGIDDAVLRDLARQRTGEMKDIVQTIHAAQNALIRSPIDQLLVIQGGPGTGKTAIALHRVSWMLYNERNLRASDVLVVGPNPTFTRYIRAVLPGLGDVDVSHKDLRSLGPIASRQSREDPDVARLKGEARMAGLVSTALRQRVRFPERDDFVEVPTSRRAVRFNREQVVSVLPRFLDAPTYNAGRLGLRAWFQTMIEGEIGGVHVPPAGLDNAVERVWPNLTPQAFLREFFQSRERLLDAAGDVFTAGDVARLMRPASDRIVDEQWSDADVALLDELDELMNGSTATYSHVVVDEAQDLSPMQLRSIRRRSKNGAMTIVGDMAQSTGPWARDNWDEITSTLFKGSPVAIQELVLGFRVPRQVYELAATLLPYIAPGVAAPRVVRDGPADPELVRVSADKVAAQSAAAAKEYASRGLFVGVVCPDSVRHDLETELRSLQMQWAGSSTGMLTSLNVVSPTDAKGLEFDAVVVVDPEAIVVETERGLRSLYVALTRTTSLLTVVHSGRAIPLPVTDVLASDAADVEAVTVRTVDEAPVALSEARLPRVVLQPAGSGLGSALARAAASELAAQLHASVPSHMWAAVIDQLRRELEITSDALLDLMD